MRFAGRTRLAGDIAELFRDRDGRRYVFPLRAAIEVRVTRPGHSGAVSTIRLGTAVSRKSCPLDPAGRPSAPCRPA